MLVAFTPEGRHLWMANLGHGTTHYHLGRSGSRVAIARPPDELSVVVPRASRKGLTCPFAPESVALIESADDDLVLAASGGGDLALLEARGAMRWAHSVKARCGRVHLNLRSGLITLPAHDEGVQLFTLDGEGAGAFDVGEPVVAAASGATAAGSVLALLTGGGAVLLMDTDGNVLWESAFDLPASSLALTSDGSLLVVALGNQTCLALRLTQGEEVGGQLPEFDEYATSPHAPWPGEEIIEAQIVGGDEGDLPELLPEGDGPAPPEPEPDEEWDIVAAVVEEPTEEEAPAGTEPRPLPTLGTAKLTGKIRVADADAPTSLDQLFISPGGEFACMAMADGHVVALDMAGKTLATGLIEPPARIIRRRTESLLGVWGPRELLIVSAEGGKVQTLPLESLDVRLLYCSAALDMMAVVDAVGQLTLARPGREVLARVTVQPAPRRLAVSPDGKVITTEDAERRRRFFDCRGRQVHKQRFAVDEDFPQVVVENAFCAFGGTEGHVVLQDAGGKAVSRRKVLRNIARLESLGSTIGIYDAGGQCLVMAPYGNIEARFALPPGPMLVRKPRSGSIVALSAQGNVLTAYSGGLRTEPTPLWEFECKDRIVVFDASADADRAVIVAGERVYFIEAPAAQTSAEHAGPSGEQAEEG